MRNVAAQAKHKITVADACFALYEAGGAASAEDWYRLYASAHPDTIGGDEKFQSFKTRIQQLARTGRYVTRKFKDGGQRVMATWDPSNPKAYVYSLNELGRSEVSSKVRSTQAEQEKLAHLAKQKIYREGEKKLVSHEKRERSSALVKAFLSSLDSFDCSICTFNFQSFYNLGAEHNFLEAHHVVPIALGKRISRPEDLMAVCANCHRMLHRQPFNTPDELRSCLAYQKVKRTRNRKR